MSAKLDQLTSIGTQQPTDLMYIVREVEGPAGSHNITADDLFALITQNIADGAVRFQNVAAPAVSAAGQGAIYFDSTLNRFRFSENNGAYRNLGDVSGPGASTDNAIARFDGTTGKLIQHSVVTVGDTGNMAGVGTLNAHTIPAVAADTFALLNASQTFTNKTITASSNVLGGVTMILGGDATGDIYYRGVGGQLTRLAIGAANQVLTVVGGLPTWAAAQAVPPGGANTQVQFNNAGAFGGVSGFTSDGTNVTAGDGNLRATSPLITTGIDDANGNTIIGLSPVVSAVNQISIANAAIGNGPVISATGADLNIPLTFSPKGTGLNTFTKNLLLNTGTGPLDNVIYISSAASGAVNASFGFFVGGSGSQAASEGPYFFGRGNSFTAIGGQRGNLFFAAGLPNTPTGTEGSINFFTDSPEVLRQQIRRDGTMIISGPEAYFGNGITSATPQNYLLNATGGNGTNVAGASLQLVGGRGTGNALPGFVAVRYPLITASGSTLQSLTTAQFPVVTNMWTAAAITVVSNTAAETSLLTNGSPGSTTVIQGGQSHDGQIYHFRLDGAYDTATASPVMTIRIKVGGTTIATLTSTGINPIAGIWRLELDLWISGGQAVVGYAYFDWTNGAAGTLAPNHVFGSGLQSINFTVDQTLDVTAQWSQASGGNIWTRRAGRINVIR